MRISAMGRFMIITAIGGMRTATCGEFQLGKVTTLPEVRTMMRRISSLVTHASLLEVFCLFGGGGCGETGMSSYAYVREPPRIFRIWSLPVSGSDVVGSRRARNSFFLLMNKICLLIIVYQVVEMW
ncbi:hypothetical protein EV421DRAFT_1432690 [Armillaria borealis]|uniref:Uncharacterized protein n=1 Tax=Armillaria borealis TaxID=47425 RepID=A0AA39MGG7_9AGAR|nr:hypothetical protein EV421DRAFT_1432690 [Armillaria borealis]